MKMLKLTTAAAVMLAVCAVVFYGCKKNSTDQTKEQADLRAIYTQKLKDQPAISTLIVNIKGKAFYGDINGNRIIATPEQSNKMTGTSCPDPGSSEVEQEFVSMDREYTCGVGYRFVVTYKIISEFYPVMSISPTQFSGGSIRLKTANNVTITTTALAPLINIQNNGVVGTNSNGDDMNEFIVKYRSNIVSETNYNNAANIQPNCFLYTDCINYATIPIAFSTQQSVAVTQHNILPCLRVDKVHWSPGGGGMPPSLSGTYASSASCFPSGYVFPHRQEIQFKNGSGVWKPFYLHINGLANPGVETSLITHVDVWLIDIPSSQTYNGLAPGPTGNVEVRFRNNLMGTSSNGGPCVTQPDGTWLTEIWDLQ